MTSEDIRLFDHDSNIDCKGGKTDVLKAFDIASIKWDTVNTSTSLDLFAKDFGWKYAPIHASSSFNFSILSMSSKISISKFLNLIFMSNFVNYGNKGQQKNSLDFLEFYSDISEVHTLFFRVKITKKKSSINVSNLKIL